MAVDENKLVVRRWYDDYVNRHDLGVLDELLTQDFVNHVPSNAPGNGKAELGMADGLLFAAFPDLRLTIEDMITDGDKIVVRYSALGTHQGSFYGAAPTGKTLTSSGIDVFRCVNGKVAERWLEADFLGFLQQLGIFPSPS